VGGGGGGGRGGWGGGGEEGGKGGGGGVWGWGNFLLVRSKEGSSGGPFPLRSVSWPGGRSPD